MKQKWSILIVGVFVVSLFAVPPQALATSPTITVSGAGTYSSPATVTLNGTIQDMEGGDFNYIWLQAADGNPVDVGCSGTLTAGTSPVDVPACEVAGLTTGEYGFVLSVTDKNEKPNAVSLFSEPVAVSVIEGPTLAPTVSPSILWPPNNKLVPVVVTPNAVDGSGVAPTITASVVSSERVKLVGKARRVAWDQPIYNEDGTITFMLPAQRLGQNRGRVYTITVTATDADGNLNSADVLVRVPHDKRKAK